MSDFFQVGLLEHKNSLIIWTLPRIQYTPSLKKYGASCESKPKRKTGNRGKSKPVYFQRPRLFFARTAARPQSREDGLLELTELQNDTRAAHRDTGAEGGGRRVEGEGRRAGEIWGGAIFDGLDAQSKARFVRTMKEAVAAEAEAEEEAPSTTEKRGRGGAAVKEEGARPKRRARRCDAK